MFLTPLRVQKLEGDYWILTDHLIYESENKMFKGTLIAVAGFQTNFASIPRPLWSIFPKMGKWDMAAVMHDAAYGHSLYTPSGIRINLIKKYADKLFYDAMLDCGVNIANAKTMYQLVKVFGNPKKHPLIVGPVYPPSTKLQS